MSSFIFTQLECCFSLTTEQVLVCLEKTQLFINSWIIYDVLVYFLKKALVETVTVLKFITHEELYS